MSNLFTCYAPSGEKFELTRANYLDVTENFGFTTNPPHGTSVEEAPLEDEEVPAKETLVEDDDEPVADDDEPVADDEGDEAPVEDDEPADDENDDADAPVTFKDKEEAKAFLRDAKIEFDGRANLETLTALANGETAE